MSAKLVLMLVLYMGMGNRLIAAEEAVAVEAQPVKKTLKATENSIPIPPDISLPKEANAYVAELVGLLNNPQFFLHHRADLLSFALFYEIGNRGREVSPESQNNFAAALQKIVAEYSSDANLEEISNTDAFYYRENGLNKLSDLFSTLVFNKKHNGDPYTLLNEAQTTYCIETLKPQIEKQQAAIQAFYMGKRVAQAIKQSQEQTDPWEKFYRLSSLLFSTEPVSSDDLRNSYASALQEMVEGFTFTSIPSDKSFDELCTSYHLHEQMFKSLSYLAVRKASGEKIITTTLTPAQQDYVISTLTDKVKQSKQLIINAFIAQKKLSPLAQQLSAGDIVVIQCLGEGDAQGKYLAKATSRKKYKRRYGRHYRTAYRTIGNINATGSNKYEARVQFEVQYTVPNPRWGQPGEAIRISLRNIQTRQHRTMLQSDPNVAVFWQGVTLVGEGLDEVYIQDHERYFYRTEGEALERDGEFGDNSKFKIEVIKANAQPEEDFELLSALYGNLELYKHPDSDAFLTSNVTEKARSLVEGKTFSKHVHVNDPYHVHAHHVQAP